MRIKQSTLILCSTQNCVNLNLVGQCFVLYALLKCFSNLPKTVNCGNIAILGGSGQMNSPFAGKFAQKLSWGLNTSHSYYVVQHNIMVVIVLLISVLSCMQFCVFAKQRRRRFLTILILLVSVLSCMQFVCICPTNK